MLIGGQAVSVWAHLYFDELPTALKGVPLTSKDIDFCGDNKAVRLAAERLNGKALFPSMDDPTPNVGVVQYVDSAGETRGIDFLGAPHGINSEKEVNDRAQSIELLDETGKGTGQFYLVLHPVHSLVSRVSNVATLPGYDTLDALQQLDASIHSCRGFIRQVLKDVGVRAALNLNEEVIAVACSVNGRTVHKKHGRDPFEAVVCDSSLPEKFTMERYPRVAQWLEKKRAAPSKP